MAYKYKALDLPYSEQAEFTNYVSNYNLLGQEIDFEGLADYEEDDTVLNAYVLNRIEEDTDIMQSHWDEDVISDLHNKYNLFQSWIDNMASVAQVWVNDASKLYYKNDIVITSPDNGAYYICLQNCNGSQALPTLSQRSNEYWVAFYSQGEKGQPAFELNYRGEFNWMLSPYEVNDIVYVVNAYDIAFYTCIADITYDASITPSEDEEHWLLIFKVNIPALKILDEQPIILKLYPSNLLYPSLNLFPTNTEIIADSKEENKIFGAKSTQLFSNIYLADFFDMNINEQADIQSKTSLTQIAGISIAQWIQNFMDKYNL